MLIQAAHSYSALCEYQFLLGLGRKGIYKRITISFPESAFHHLAGFQYVTRNPKFTSKRQALHQVKTRIITEGDFDSIKNLDMIKNRWRTISLLESALQSFQHIMEYSRSQGPDRSNIRAKYVLPYLHDDDTHYIFFNGKSDDEMVPVSCLVDNHWQYELGCTKWTVLKIEKKNTSNNSFETLFSHKNLKPDPG